MTGGGAAAGGGGGAAAAAAGPPALPGIRRYLEDVETGSVTCEEYMWRIGERIERLDGSLHAYLALNRGAMEEAREVDRRVREGLGAGPLLGLPVAVKDNICVSSMPTTCASRMLEGYVPPYDATAAARLAGAGAIITGKTNMDEFAMGLTTEFSAFGPSRNPWDARIVPGGSSGGSAAAVSACECMAALGSDTGGSVRNPASFCGIVGHKPTYGLVSRYGLVSYANSIEQIGPMARTVEDAALVLGAIAGRDPRDDTTIGAPDHAGIGAYADGLGGGVEGLRVGVVGEMAEGGIVEEGVAAAVRRAASAAERAGASCEDVSLGMAEFAVAAYYTITSAEAGSNLARYDGIRYGGDASADPGAYEFNAYVERARGLLGPEVKRRMILGGFVPSAGHAGRYYLKALKVRERLTRQVDEALSRVDVLLSPTVPVAPFEFGEMIDDPVRMFAVDYATVLANLTGKPAASVPFGRAGGRGGRLPVGVQVMGGAMRDALVLRAAAALEEAAGPVEAPAL